MSISIITNKKVDKTFEGEECLLKRTIINVSKLVLSKHKEFKIVTERCNYYDMEVEDLDADGNVQYDGDNNPIMKTISVLKILNQKDKASNPVFTFDEIDTLFEQVKPQIPEGLSKMQGENLEEQIALLALTQQDKPYGTLPEDWILL